MNLGASAGRMKYLMVFSGIVACAATPKPPSQEVPRYGTLPVEVMQRVVYASMAPFNRCYDEALKKDRSVAGRTTTKFVIDVTGHVSSSVDVEDHPSLPKEMSNCVVEIYKTFVFPPPRGGPVTVIHQELFSRPTRNETFAEKGRAARDLIRYGNAAADRFDKHRAEEALEKAGLAIDTCAKRNGPTGRGHAAVIFDPSGRVSSVRMDPPFAGTDAGACIESVFASVTVPPFYGHDMHLGWNITLQVHSPTRNHRVAE